MTVTKTYSDVERSDALQGAAALLGSTLIAINQAEQALDHLIIQRFRLEAASLTMLPFIDFRSKVTLVRDDSLLTSIVGSDTIKRLHRLYDERNIIAHGYFDMPLPGDQLRPSNSTGDWKITHARRGQSLSATQVLGLRRLALSLIELLIEARVELEDFAQPLAELRAHMPHLTPNAFVAWLKTAVADLAAD